MNLPETGTSIMKMQLVLAGLIILVISTSPIAFAIMKSNENVGQPSVDSNLAVGTGIIPIDDRRHQPLGETIVNVDDRRHQLMYDINLIDNMQTYLRHNIESPTVSMGQNGNMAENSSPQMFTPINPAIMQPFIKTLDSISQNETDPNTKLSIQNTIQALANGDANSVINGLGDIHDKITQQLTNLTILTIHK